MENTTNVLNPFENNDKFKQLSADAQKLVLDKYNSLSDQAKAIVSQKLSASSTPTEDPIITKQKELISNLEAQKIDPTIINAQKQKLDIMQKKGTADTALPFSLQSQPFESTGDNIATGLAASGINPTLAAAAGTAFKMLPDIAASLPMPGMGEAVAEGTAAGAKALAETSLGKAVRYTGQKEVERLSEKAAELPLRMGDKARLAKEVRRQAKDAIQMAEEKAGIGLKQLGGVPQEIISNKKRLSAFAGKVGALSDKGAQYLADNTDIKTLQKMRKIAEEGYKAGGVNDQAMVQLAKAKKTFSDAIELQSPEIKDAMSRYEEIEKVIRALPDEAKRQKQLLNIALAKARNVAKDQARTRMRAGAGAVAAGAALVGRKVVNKITGD